MPLLCHFLFYFLSSFFYILYHFKESYIVGFLGFLLFWLFYAADGSRSRSRGRSRSLGLVMSCLVFVLL